MAQIPPIKKPRFYDKKWIVECIAIIPPIIVVVVTAWANFLDPTKTKLGWVLVAGIVWLSIASFFKVRHAYQQDKEEKSKQSYDGLLGALHVLYGSISRYFQFAENDAWRLRVTIHRVVPPAEPDGESEELEQVLPYIGGEGGGAGRKFSIHTGIIGRAAREKAPFAFSRVNDDYEAFVKELQSNWAYTEADARKLRSDRKAWMAVPIMGDNNVVLAVVYLDSNEREFFGEAAKPIVINSCSGIASYIDERYT